jgi:hypothetical protein
LHSSPVLSPLARGTRQFVQQPVEAAKPDVSQPSITPEPEETQILFAGRLRIAEDEVQLTSDRLYYDIHVRYPQLEGSDDPYIKKLNQRIRRLAVDRYQWMLSPSKKDLLRYQTSPGGVNSIDLHYKIVLATESILSIYFISFDYGIGAAHSVITSQTINYDLESHKELKLADLFKPNTKYLEFIALYCMGKLRLLRDPLPPKAETFSSWNLTSNGLQLTFDACAIAGCAEGAKEVTIPFSDLEPFLKQPPVF